MIIIISIILLSLSLSLRLFSLRLFSLLSFLSLLSFAQHVQVDVTNVVLRNMMVARYKTNGSPSVDKKEYGKSTVKMLHEKLKQSTRLDQKDAIRADIQNVENVLDENVKRAEQIEKHRNTASTLLDAMAWIEGGERIVSPSFFAYSEKADDRVRFDKGIECDNVLIREENRVWYPQSMVDMTFKIIASETKPSPYCTDLGLRNIAHILREGGEHLGLQWSRVYNSHKSQSKAVNAAILACKKDLNEDKCGPVGGLTHAACNTFCGPTPDPPNSPKSIAANLRFIKLKDLYISGENVDPSYLWQTVLDQGGMGPHEFFESVGLLDDCLNDLWMRWSFAFQARSWENIFQKKGSPSSALSYTRHRVKDFDRDLVKELVWDNVHAKKCASSTLKEKEEMKTLTKIEKKSLTAKDSARLKKLTAMVHRCWMLLENGMGLAPYQRLTQHALL